MATASGDRQGIWSRWIPHPLLTLTLTAVWMLLVNDLSPGALLLGLLLGLVIPRLTAPFWPHQPHIRNYGAVVRYCLLVVGDIVRANLQVARIILFRPVQSLHTRWVVVPLELTNPEAVSVLAGTITLTPGTVSCDLAADGRSLLVHCLDAPDPEAAVRGIKLALRDLLPAHSGHNLVAFPEAGVVAQAEKDKGRDDQQQQHQEQLLLRSGKYAGLGKLVFDLAIQNDLRGDAALVFLCQCVLLLTQTDLVLQ